MSTRILLALLLALSQCGGPPAPKQPQRVELKVIDEDRDGRHVRLTVDSPALGDRAVVEVLLPEGWKPGTKWPILYLLEGCCHRGEVNWISLGKADELTKDAGVLVVVPEGGVAGFYSDWRKGPRWETFHLTEVRRLMEQRYGATDRRAVAGLSMGGFGALSYAARHPGMFRAAASFSGLVNATRQDADHLTRQSGEISTDLWAEEDIPQHNPTALVSKLKDLPVYVACGNGEPGPLDSGTTARDGGEAFIEGQNRLFVAAASAAGVRLTANLYGPGTHAWPYWTRELGKALPMLLGEIR